MKKILLTLITLASGSSFGFQVTAFKEFETAAELKRDVASPQDSRELPQWQDVNTAETNFYRIDFHVPRDEIKEYLLVLEDYRAFEIYDRTSGELIDSRGRIGSDLIEVRVHLLGIEKFKGRKLSLYGQVQYRNLAIRKIAGVSMEEYEDNLSSRIGATIRAGVYLTLALIGFGVFYTKNREHLFLSLGVSTIGFFTWHMFRSHGNFRFLLGFENFWVDLDFIGALLASSGTAMYIACILSGMKLFRVIYRFWLWSSPLAYPVIKIVSIVSSIEMANLLWMVQIFMFSALISIFLGTLVLSYRAFHPDDYNISNSERITFFGLIGLVIGVAYSFLSEFGFLPIILQTSTVTIGIDAFIVSLGAGTFARIWENERKVRKELSNLNNDLLTLNSELDNKVKERTRELSEEKKIVEDKNKMIETILRISAKEKDIAKLSNRLDEICGEISELFDNRPIAMVVETRRSQVISFFASHGVSNEKQALLQSLHYTVVDSGEIMKISTHSKLNFEPIFHSDTDAKKKAFGEHVTVFLSEIFEISNNLSSKAATLKVFIYGEKIPKDKMQLVEYLSTSVGNSIASTIKEDQDRQDSLIDVETGLLNKNAWAENIASVNSQQVRFNLKYAVIFGDVTDLKTLNDKYGHDAGTAAIKHCGAMLKSVTRSTDKVFRRGGDELILYMPNTNLEEAEEIRDRVKKLLESNKLIYEIEGERTKIKVVLSLGCASSDEFIESISELKRKPKKLGLDAVTDLADKKMYKDKEAYYASIGKHWRNKKKDDDAS